MTVTAVGSKKKRRRSWLQDWRLYVMLILPISFYLLFCYKPMVGIIIGFQDFNMFKGMWGSQWIGLENFRFSMGMPDFSYALYNKANILCAQKEWHDAINNYTKAIAIDEDFAEAYFNRGLTYVYIGETEKGLADLSKAGELGIYQAYNLITRFK